jgi:hypothetical protein
MGVAIFNLPNDHKETLMKLSEKTGLTLSEHLRRMVVSYQPIMEKALSGAMVVGVEVHTTSGSVWIGRGY